MNWLAIIVITTNVHGIQFMERIPADSEIACNAAVSAYVEKYDADPAKYFYDCVDIGSIVKGGK
jgi:hypothetical protein